MDDMQTQDSTIYTPMPDVIRNGGHRDLLIKQHSANMHLFTMAMAWVAIIWLKQKRKITQPVNLNLWVLG